MTQDRKDSLRRSREIADAIRQILLHDWDPIGIGTKDGPIDEYDSHIGGVYRLLASHADAAQVAAHLASIQTDRMGLPRGAESLIQVANRLLAIDVSLERTAEASLDRAFIPGDATLAELRAWAIAATPRVLTREALSAVVDRFLAGELTAAELEEIGDLLEYEFVDYDDDSEERVVAQVLFEMSAPEANGAVDRAAAIRWREMLLGFR